MPNIIETASKLFDDKKIHDDMGELAVVIAGACFGDPVAIAMVPTLLGKCTYDIKAQWLWAKIQLFIEGALSTDTDKLKFRDILSSNQNLEENILRLIECIDSLDTKSKVKYVANATVNLLAERLALADYYRVINVVKNTLSEDLEFLKVNISEEKMLYSYAIQGLFNSGLVYMSVQNSAYGKNDGENRYSFTKLAALIYANIFFVDGSIKAENIITKMNVEIPGMVLSNSKNDRLSWNDIGNMTVVK